MLLVIDHFWHIAEGEIFSDKSNMRKMTRIFLTGKGNSEIFMENFLKNWQENFLKFSMFVESWHRKTDKIWKESNKVFSKL